MKTILAIDTSGPVLSVALQSGNNSIQEKVHFGALEHMEHLLPFADELLKSQKKTIAEVDEFIINRGPGSFTGLRIGFSTLQGLIAANPKPCFGCNSLDSLAARIPLQGHYLAVVLDAFRSKFYVKIYENKSGWFPVSDTSVMGFDETINKLPAGAAIAGDALRRYSHLFSEKFSVLGEDLWYPRASSMLYLKNSRAEMIQKLVSSDDFLPVYLRQSEPEERRNEKASSQI